VKTHTQRRAVGTRALLWPAPQPAVAAGTPSLASMLSRRLTRKVLIPLVVCAGFAWGAPAAFSENRSEHGPLLRLTQYGHDLLELDALLHDTFGKRLVSLRGGSYGSPSNFTSRFVAVAQGGPYIYTFADASHSTFKLARPAWPPKRIGSSAWPYTATPLTVSGAYVSCGHRLWLFQNGDVGGVNAFVACLTSSGRTSPSSDARQVSVPATRLTPYGHVTWELDALLHDVFGERRVYLRYGNPYSETLSDFSARFVKMPKGGVYAYTFAGPVRSAFKPMTSARPPRLVRGATESSYPFMLRGAYISCGRARWLYEPEGDPNVNQFARCS
jgi:hypothetical protein